MELAALSLSLFMTRWENEVGLGPGAAVTAAATTGAGGCVVIVAAITRRSHVAEGDLAVGEDAAVAALGSSGGLLQRGGQWPRRRRLRLLRCSNVWRLVRVHRGGGYGRPEGSRAVAGAPLVSARGPRRREHAVLLMLLYPVLLSTCSVRRPSATVSRFAGRQH